MSTIDNPNFFHKVFSPFEELSKLAVRGIFNEEILAPFKPMDLRDLLESFYGIAPSNFLTPLALQDRLKEIHELSGRLRIEFPEGLMVTLVALPCDLAGNELPSDQLNDLNCSRRPYSIFNKRFPYLFTLLSNPNDPMSMTENYHGGVAPAPFLKVLPPEVVNAGSFIVKYEPLIEDAGQTTQQKDYEAIAYPFIRSFHRLAQLYFRKTK
jgi:hypothetical protein